MCHKCVHLWCSLISKPIITMYISRVRTAITVGSYQKKSVTNNNIISTYYTRRYTNPLSPSPPTRLVSTPSCSEFFHVQWQEQAMWNSWVEKCSIHLPVENTLFSKSVNYFQLSYYPSMVRVKFVPSQNCY